MTKKIIRIMKKKQYIYPEVSVDYFDTEKLMKASQLSDKPIVPGAPRRRTDVF